VTEGEPFIATLDEKLRARAKRVIRIQKWYDIVKERSNVAGSEPHLWAIWRGGVSDIADLDDPISKAAAKVEIAVKVVRKIGFICEKDKEYLRDAGHALVAFADAGKVTIDEMKRAETFD
jgi:hypothetical protein